VWRRATGRDGVGGSRLKFHLKTYNVVLSNGKSGDRKDIIVKGRMAIIIKMI
jgi:hypothetical protein